MCDPELRSFRPHARRTQRGLSIIEIMVGIVVALLVGLAAIGGAVTFTASQRQGIGTGGSLLSATNALAVMRDDASAAGLGFFGDARFLCPRLNLGVGTSVVHDGTAFTPVRVTAETRGDRIDVVYATQVTSGANVLLAAPSAGDTAQLRSLLPVSSGQVVLLAPPVPGDPCLVRSVTAVAASTDDTPQLLSFGTAGPYNQAEFTAAAAFADRGRVTLLGQLRWSRFRLEGTDLRLERPLGGDPVVLARHVVAFRVQYGLAAAASGSTALEAWQGADGAFAALAPGDLPRVRALRIGLVTRSPQPEKPNAAGECEATTALPELFGQAIAPDVDDWSCFRYRTVIAAVPLRNLVMGMTP
jgi:type IV pilus assembly protein PilW